MWIGIVFFLNLAETVKYSAFLLDYGLHCQPSSAESTKG